MRIPDDYIDKNICVIGLGYVGLTLAVVLAEVGYKVFGVETNSDIVELVSNGSAHFMETGLDVRLRSQVNHKTISATADLDSVPDVSVYVVTVGTPLLTGTKETNLSAIEHVARSIAKRLKEGDLVILRSTVRIGVSREIVMPILDSAGVQYNIAFCPERTLEGKALLELVSLPQIIGAADSSSMLRAAQLFSFLTPTIIKMSSLEAAELVKLVNNTQRDLMFSFANEIAGYADAVGINAKEVITAANMGYPRSTLAAPGPVGGPCLEKDPYILAEGITKKAGAAPLALLGRAVNEGLIDRVVEFLVQHYKPSGGRDVALKIGVIGLAFKGRPETSDLRGSMAVPLIHGLRSGFPSAKICGYDPACRRDELSKVPAEIVDSEEAIFAEADIIIFHNNNVKYQKYDLNLLASLMNTGGLIYDLWMQFDNFTANLENNVTYGGLGRQFVFQKVLLE